MSGSIHIWRQIFGDFWPTYLPTLITWFTTSTYLEKSLSAWPIYPKNCDVIYGRSLSWNWVLISSSNVHPSGKLHINKSNVAGYISILKYVEPTFWIQSGAHKWWHQIRLPQIMLKIILLKFKFLNNIISCKKYYYWKISILDSLLVPKITLVRGYIIHTTGYKEVPE